MLQLHTSVGFMLRTGINQQKAQMMMMMMMVMMMMVTSCLCGNPAFI